MFKEDLLTTNFVEKEKEKAINRIVNMEKQVYYPVYIKDDGSRDFIEKIVFNLHFRERSGDNWLVEMISFGMGQIMTPTHHLPLNVLQVQVIQHFQFQVINQTYYIT